MSVIEYDVLAKVSDGLGLEPEEMIRVSYSGRGMYGDSCFGLYVDDQRELVKFFIELTTIDQDTAIDLADALRTDTMGRSLIAYFPGWTLEGAPDFD
jgi:hypothetical protein